VAEGRTLGGLLRRQELLPVGLPGLLLGAVRRVDRLLGDDDLTDGAVIAGTGTIDAQGKVGPIGGITLKMVTAKDIGAELFLVPADNCDEATGVADPGFPLARVADLDDALKALSDFEAGRTPATC
jgi:PDZ domain-containing protein